MSKFSGKVRKAVFPVAGLGTRFLPATKASPKEMLPVVDKPLIQYAVEEAAAAGFAPPLESDETDGGQGGDAESDAGDAALLKRRRAAASSPMARLGLLTRNQASLAGVDPSPTHTFSVAPVAAADPRAFVDNLPGGAGGGAGGGGGGSSGLWQELHDDQGRPYYYNTQTMVTQWEKPADF